MPLYEYQCSLGHITTAYATVAGRLVCPPCESCGAETEKVILRPPRVFGDLAGYESPATGRWIEGRRAREEDLRVSGCRPYEAGEREEMVRRQEAHDRATERAIDAAVETTVNELLG